MDACRFFNAGRITKDELTTATTLGGFNNVIDAFHVVGEGEIQIKFFIDERRGATRGIRLTDELLQLCQDPSGLAPFSRTSSEVLLSSTKYSTTSCCWRWTHPEMAQKTIRRGMVSAAIAQLTESTNHPDPWIENSAELLHLMERPPNSHEASIKVELLPSQLPNCTQVSHQTSSQLPQGRNSSLLTQASCQTKSGWLQ